MGIGKDDVFYTIKSAVTTEFIEKKSRFISTISPVATNEQAQELITRISKEHYNATHNVFAFILRDGDILRQSDNGEPQGTAGVPTLEVIRKEGLTNVCVVTTRYFGGILLGGGGLVRAYSTSASLAVNAAQRIAMRKAKTLTITCEYGFYGKLSYILPDYEVETANSKFLETVTLTLVIKSELCNGFIKAVTELSSGQVVPCIISEDFKEYPIK